MEQAAVAFVVEVNIISIAWQARNFVWGENHTARRPVPQILGGIAICRVSIEQDVEAGICG
ncbi:MAG: hypothetical protein IPM25_20220 [Chloracidobacterium sp.]|nr:hypothetical protein [Chloracidobacterium sp.]